MTDAELDAVMIAARSLPSERRAEFLEALGFALTHSAACGPGVVEGAIRATRRDLLGPPAIATIIFR
jgi:hypothetical protein